MPIRFPTPVRLAIVVGIIGLVQLLSWRVQAMLKPGEVVLPNWKLEELPLDFAGWRGEIQELDERLFLRTGADVVSDREYTDRDGKIVSAHTALFTDFDEAIVVHLPSRCYSAAGWNLLGAEKRDLAAPGAPPVKVEISTWEFEGMRVKVLYWYQLGEQSVLDRFDLSKARMAFAGHKTWPAMVKVMLQTSADQGPAADLRLLDVAQNIRQWLHQHGGTATPVAPDAVAETGDAEPADAAAADGL